MDRWSCRLPDRCRPPGSRPLEGAEDGRWGKGKKRPAHIAATTIGTVGFSIAGDETKTVRVELNAAGGALLKAENGRPGASLTILELAPNRENTQMKAVRLVEQKMTPTEKKKL